MPLAASPQTSEPDDADVIAEGRQQVCVGRHREVGEIAFHHGPEPPSQSRMAVALIVPTRRLISRPLLDWPEHDGRLGRVGIALAARRACPQEIGQSRLYPQRPTDTQQLSTSVALPVA